MAKIGWPVKKFPDDDEWIFTTEAPARWVSEFKQIVYFEVERS